MKDSGVSWIGKVPTSWVPNKVGTSFLMGSGTTPPTSEQQWYDGAIPWVQTSELRENVIFETSKSVSVEAINKFSALRLYKTGSVLVAMYGATIGRVGILGINAATNQACCVLTERIGITVVFAFWWFQGMRDELIERGNGGGQPNISQSVIAGLRIFAPNKQEQLSIARHLDGQTALIDQRLSTLAEKKTVLAELRKATIHEAVTKGLHKTTMKDSGVAWIGEIPEGWRLVRIKDISPVNRGASPRPIDDPIYFDDDGEYAWVRISDVSASLDGFLESTTQKLSKLGDAKSIKRQPGDLFLSIAGTVGKACITKIKACIHDGFVYFPRMNEEATKKFFFYLFNSGLAYDGLGKFGTQLNLNTETVGSILVPLPPLDEQRAIANHLDQQTQHIDAQLATLDEQAQLLKELRKAIIHEAVTGKIALPSPAGGRRVGDEGL